MTSTQRVQDALLPAGDPDVRTVAGHVHRRTDRRTTAQAPPPPKAKSKSGTGLNKAERKKLDTGDNGESDSDEEDKKRRFPDDAEDLPSKLKSRSETFLSELPPFYMSRKATLGSRISMAQRIRDFDLLFDCEANAPRKATR